jgi:hypothetical protein
VGFYIINEILSDNDNFILDGRRQAYDSIREQIHTANEGSLVAAGEQDERPLTSIRPNTQQAMQMVRF